MAFPPQYRETTPSLPSLLSPGSGRYRSHHDIPYSRSTAISIPGLDPKEDVPPPLPPPRILPFHDVSSHPEDVRRELRDYGRSASSAQSGYGSMGSSFVDEQTSFKRRDTGNGTNGDEGYASYTAVER